MLLLFQIIENNTKKLMVLNYILFLINQIPNNKSKLYNIKIIMCRQMEKKSKYKKKLII